MNIRISSPGLCWPLPESPDSSFATFVNAVLKVQFCSSSPRAHFCLRSVCICCWGRKSLPQIFASLTPSQSLRPSSCVSRLLGAAIPSLSPSSPGWYSALNSTTSFYFWIYVIYQHSSLSVKMENGLPLPVKMEVPSVLLCVFILSVSERETGFPSAQSTVTTHTYSLNERKGRETMYKYTWSILEVNWQNKYRPSK